MRPRVSNVLDIARGHCRGDRRGSNRRWSRRRRFDIQPISVYREFLRIIRVFLDYDCNLTRGCLDKYISKRERKLKRSPYNDEYAVNIRYDNQRGWPEFDTISRLSFVGQHIT